MSPTVRLIWMLMRWPGVALVSGLSLQVAGAIAAQSRQQFILLLVSLGAVSIWVADRYKNFAASRVWRWVPDGERVLTRSLAILVLVGMAVPGVLTCWAQVHGVVELPIRNVPLAVAALAGVGFMVFARRLPAIQPRVARAFVITLTLLFVEAIFREPAVGVSWVTTLTVGALWLVVVGTVGVEGLENPLARWRVRAHQLSTRVRASGLTHYSPARRILQTERPMFTALPVAVFGTLAVTILLHDLFEIHAHDTLSALLAGTAGFVAVAMLFMAMAAARRARLLWLRCGESRSQVLRVCERTLLMNLLVLTIACWVAVTGFAVVLFDTWRLVPRMLAALPAMMAGSLPALYLGLAWPTLARWWRDMPNGHILLAAIFLLPVVWRTAYAVVQPLELKPHALPIALIVLVALLLRGFAVWRWRKIDWSYLKTTTT